MYVFHFSILAASSCCQKNHPAVQNVAITNLGSLASDGSAFYVFLLCGINFSPFFCLEHALLAFKTQFKCYLVYGNFHDLHGTVIASHYTLYVTSMVLSVKLNCGNLFTSLFLLLDSSLRIWFVSFSLYSQYGRDSVKRHLLWIISSTPVFSYQIGSHSLETITTLCVNIGEEGWIW